MYNIERRVSKVTMHINLKNIFFIVFTRLQINRKIFEDEDFFVFSIYNGGKK